MNEKVWHINPTTKQLVSAYDVQPYAKQIVAAQPFTVSLQSVVVAEELDGWPRGDNDLLLTTSAALGESPRVQRIHFYGDDIKPKTVLKDFYAPTMFVSEDYSGTERLWLELKILEIDTDTGERKVLTNAFSKLAAGAGTVFPVAMPYAALASGIVTAVEKLISALEKNVAAIDCPVTLYPPDRPDAGRPLQTGRFVVFASETDGSKYQWEQGDTLALTGKETVDVSYAIFLVEAVKAVTPQWILSQKVATLLTQLEQGNDNSASNTLVFLDDTLTQYANFKDLSRYAELKAKDPAALSDQEKQLMAQIAKREILKQFLPK
jgi:hypothetical protein